jgi:hypothetical protein
MFESILVAPNLSHGVLPLFLFFLSAYVMCCVADRWQGPVLAFLVLLTSYTGFAFFSTMLMIPFLFIKFWRSIDKGLKRTFFFSGVFALFLGASSSTIIHCDLQYYVSNFRTTGQGNT